MGNTSNTNNKASDESKSYAYAQPKSIEAYYNYTRSTAQKKKSKAKTNKKNIALKTLKWEANTMSSIMDKINDKRDYSEIDIKTLLVSGYIRHCISVLLNEQTIIPLEIIVLCERFYEANMILFVVKSSSDYSYYNSIECLNLNCNKIIQMKITNIRENTSATQNNSKWGGITSHMFHISNIDIPNNLFLEFYDTLSRLKLPSIILKCNLNAWRRVHQPKIIIFDQKLLNNWNFQNENINNATVTNVIQANTKTVNAYAIDLPSIGTKMDRMSKILCYAYSEDHGFIAATDNWNEFYHLSFEKQQQNVCIFLFFFFCVIIDHMFTVVMEENNNAKIGKRWIL